MVRCMRLIAVMVLVGNLHVAAAFGQTTEPVDVEGQPLARNVERLLQALDFLGHPLEKSKELAVRKGIDTMDALAIQRNLDSEALFLVHLNPESRVKVKRGSAKAALQQGGYTPMIVKVHNESTVTKPLRISSPQALPIYSRGKAGEIKDIRDRFLDVSMFNQQPLTDRLSGLKVEYGIALIHSSQAGKREATIVFDVGQGTQDLGFRSEVPVLFEVRTAIPVKLTAFDVDGSKTTARYTFTDKMGRIYPPKSKRLAPDFFFQDQVYRHSGGIVMLPPGELTMTYGRGPEYRLNQQKITIPEKGEAEFTVQLQRWIDPAKYGFYSGDHHIHAAGCAHYTNPTEGVFADDMFLHVKGEGMHVGCNLTWGPCFEFQRQFFEPTPHKLSEPFTVLKYDIEVSGFGSQALGHVCLLNLRDQTYPGSDGTKERGWPTWTTPLMKWAKNQGAYTGYAHSANGLQVDAKAASKRLLDRLGGGKSQKISLDQAKAGLLPESFTKIDSNNDGEISADEMIQSHLRAAQTLPNLAVPEMNGIGAQEICVTSAQGICDFISAMDTQRIPEWNIWYHIMNCGFPLKASGETDFPCITGSRVGQGRVYVQQGKIDRIEWKDWVEGLGKGRSYVSDGYAHALQFTVNGKTPGDKADLIKPGKVHVKARVAFSGDVALGTAVGGQVPSGKDRLVEVIVNGNVVASKKVPADDKEHDLDFEINVDRSSWIALRQFPQMHTNPVSVLVGNEPIRASRKSAEWCIQVIEQLWRVRKTAIAAPERDEAERTFQWAIERYRKIAQECPAGS